MVEMLFPKFKRPLPRLQKSRKTQTTLFRSCWGKSVIRSPQSYPAISPFLHEYSCLAPPTMNNFYINKISCLYMEQIKLLARSTSIGSFVLFVCFCCFTSHVNSYGHCGTVSSLNHTFSWAGLSKRLTSNLCTYFRL